MACKKTVSFLLALLLALGCAVPAFAQSESLTYSAAGEIADIFEERTEQHPGKITLSAVLNFIVEFNRDLRTVIGAQFMSDSEIDAAVQNVLSTCFVCIDYDFYVNKEVASVAVPLSFNDNYKALLNVKVLRAVCTQLYDMQFQVITPERPDLDVTPYEHYVGELAIHVLAYLIIKDMGGYNSLMPDYFFKVSQAELNVNEPRLKSVIVFLSKVLA